MLSNNPFFLENSEEHACLLLHGLGGGVYELELLGQYLFEQGLTVQAINYPGHDHPALEMPTSMWEEWYEHILENYKSLAQRYESVSVIGFSTGCPLGLYLASAHSIQRLVLLSPFMAIKYEWYYLFPPEAYLFSIGQLIDNVPRLRLPIKDKQMRLEAEQVSFFKSFNLPSSRSALRLIEHVKPKLSEIKVPTLIIQPSRDTVVDPSGAEYIYDVLGSSIKRLYWLQESDHISPLDVEREKVFAQVHEFLQSKYELS
jgi:carboxylesterase